MFTWNVEVDINRVALEIYIKGAIARAKKTKKLGSYPFYLLRYLQDSTIPTEARINANIPTYAY